MAATIRKPLPLLYRLLNLSAISFVVIDVIRLQLKSFSFTRTQLPLPNHIIISKAQIQVFHVFHSARFRTPEACRTSIQCHFHCNEMSATSILNVCFERLKLMLNSKTPTMNLSFILACLAGLLICFTSCL